MNPIRQLWRKGFARWCAEKAIWDRSRRAWWSWHTVRPRILATRPVPVPHGGPCEIHLLTSGQDWMNALWTLKSFFRVSGEPLPLAVHDDGTVPAEAAGHFAGHFPGLRWIRPAERETEVLAGLAGYPRCRAFRESNKLSRKIFDLMAARRAERVLLLDSDLLFFAPPDALLDAAYGRTERNVFNRDVDSAYTVSAADVRERCGIELVPRINSGLAVLHGASLRLDWFEEFLGLPNVLSHSWRIEQTMFALASCRYGVDLLPPEYDVRLERGGPFGPVRHYVGAVRHLMYEEGMERLWREGLAA